MIEWIPHIPAFVQAEDSAYEHKSFTNFEKLKNYLLEENSGFLNDNWKLVYDFECYSSNDTLICIMVVNEKRNYWWVRGHIADFNEYERQNIEKDSLFHKFVKWIRNSEGKAVKMEIK